MIKNKHIAILVTLMFALTMFSPVAYALNFSDISGHWAEDQIKSMTDEGIINGYPEGTFQPDGKITRAEFASLLVTAFGLTKGEGKSFTDTVDHWAKDAIAAANAAGIVNGYSDTIFGPDDPITREQMAVMIVKAARLTDAANAKTFADSSSISDWAKEAVDIATSNQLISGYPDNTFQPQGHATRAEAAAVLSGLLKKTTPPAKPAEKVEEEQEEDTVIEEPVESTNRGGGSSSSSSSSKTKVSAISISGDAVVGKTLTANPTPAGATGSYQWMRADAADGTYSNISGATSKTYEIQAGDAGKYIKVEVKGTGNYTGTKESTAVGPVGAAPLSDSKEITSFKFEIGGNSYEGVIDQANLTIAVEVPYATNISALIPDIVHTGVSYSPATAQNFNDSTSNPVKYTVYAEDGTFQEYSVTVTIAAPVTHTLTYQAGEGGTLVVGGDNKGKNYDQTVIQGENGSQVTAVPDVGYEFTGWSTGETTPQIQHTNVQSSGTYTASFAKIKYTVTFVDHDNTVLKTQTVEHGSDAIAPDNPTRTGYTFMGWDNSFTNVISDLTVTAQYAENNLTVTFDKNGGDTEADPKTMGVASGGKLASLPTEPTRSGYIFKGWNTAANGSGDTFDTNTEVNGNITVYAKWVKLQKFTVSFTANGGTGTMGSVEVTEGEEYTLPANGFTAPEHKEFAYWQVGSSTTKYYPSDKVEITANTTIKPIWQNKSIEIWNAPAKVLPGQTYKMSIYISGESQTGAQIAENVDFTITGEKSSKTKIDTTGYLTIGIDETADQFTLKAARKGSLSIYDEVTISVHHGNALIINKEDKTVDKLDSEGYSWNKDTKTLEVHNLEINEIGHGIVFSGFLYGEDVTLKLHGTNSINISAGDDPSNPEITDVVGITYSSGNKGQLIIDGDGSLEITMPDLGNEGTSYGIYMDSLTVEKNAVLKIKVYKSGTSRGIRTLNATTFKENAKVEIESYGDVIAAFGGYGNIFIKNQAEFKGTAYGKGTILNTNENIEIEEGTKVELIRPNFPNANNGPKFFDYSTSLTLADGLKLQGSENADGSSLVDAKLSGTDPNKTVVRDSDDKDVFKYVLIEAGETTKYDVTVATVVYGTATVSVDKTKAAAGDTVTVTIENIGDGKELFDLTVTGVNKKDITEVTPGSEYSFTMPASDVTVEVTVGEPDKKVKIDGSNVLTLKNGSITKDSANKDITEGTLTWSYFTEELTMSGYQGGYIQGESGSVPITIRVVGENNKITTSTEALLFNAPNIIGLNKDNDKLSIVVTGSASRAIYYNVNVKNATIDIDLSTTHKSNPIRGVHGSTTVDDGHLIVKVNKNSNAAKDAYSISDFLNLTNGGTANIEVTGATGTTKISTHQDAPWISNASKVVAAYKAGDGADADNPFAMTVTVPTTVTTIKSEENPEGDGISSILVGDKGTVTLYKSDTTTLVDTITLSEGSTFYAKTKDNKWFKITIEKETP